ncbi:MAG: PrgI family protein [Aristaeellaceae bacterium]
MAYVTVPKDLTQVKPKFLFNLTKRQFICFGGGAALGLPLFFLTKGALGSTPASLLMMLVMLPCFMFGVYEKNGQPLEKLLGYYIQSRFIRPKQRPYMTDNFYAAIQRQIDINREVRQRLTSHRFRQESMVE